MHKAGADVPILWHRTLWRIPVWSLEKLPGDCANHEHSVLVILPALDKYLN